MELATSLPVGIFRRAARVPRRWERSLARRACFALDVDAPLTVSCLEGLLWLTLEGDTRDYLLAVGQALQIPSGAHVIVQALAEARFAVAGA